VRSAFVDNAGIIAFDDTWDLSFKVETHNHPSALEPFGGANTGVGGVIRDVMGVSARPIAVTDILCFGPQETTFDQLPTGTLHPRRVREGVVSGIQDYGNKLGIPTVSGAVYYDAGYTANPLVFAGCVGIAPRNSHPTGARPGDRVIVLGGRTGRDGIHGATFSSDALAHDTGQVVGTAVQIGNPITQKDVMEVLLRARDAKLYTAITDCGAGGLSSAVGEMAQHPGGVEVELSNVPLKYPGLLPWEIWLSEAQERMVIAIAPEKWDTLKSLCDDWDVEATDIGVFTDTGKLIVRYAEKPVAEMVLDFVHDGIPRLRLKAVEPISKPVPQSNVSADSANQHLLNLLSDPNTASKEDIIRRYDHEVRTGTVIKPLMGVHNDAPSDAAVIKPMESLGHSKGFSLSVGFSIEFGKLAPYAAAKSGIIEAICNAVAVGTDPDQIALLDNFCWGDPKDAERLGSLVQFCRACHDVAVEMGTPFISGKDSLNNTYIDLDGKRLSIPDTLVISAIGIVPDVTKSITLDLKRAGNSLYLYTAGNDLLPSLRKLYHAIQDGLIVSCHDISESVAVALAEMCIAGELGAEVAIPNGALDGWFQTLAHRGEFIIEAASGTDLAAVFGDKLQKIGEVVPSPTLTVKLNPTQSPVINLPVSELTAAFKRQGKYA
jgi:phosphoribosylformylglycinamidine synthase